MPSNREWATLIWLAALASAVLWRRDSRASVISALRVLTHPKLLIPFLGLAIWVGGVVFVGEVIGAWSARQTTDTVFWFAGSLGLLLNIDRTWEDRQFFRHALAATVRFSVLIAFYVGLAQLPLWAEIVIQPVIVTVVLLATVAGTKEEYRLVKGALDSLLGIAGIGVLTGVGVYLLSDWRHINPADKGLDFALPIWLTIGVLPFVWIVSVYATYESLFVQLQFSTLDRRVPRRAKWAAILGLRGRAGLVGRLGAPWTHELVNAGTLRQALGAVRRYRAADKEGAETDDGLAEGDE